MSAFDKIIGYEDIKNELKMICDMIRHRERYERLGAVMPCGILLHGDPGLGKSLLARCFAEESGLTAYTVRKTKPDGAFVTEINEAFEKAKDHAPTIVCFDDMDKYANEDSNHRNAEEYVAIQAGIDEARGKGVLVLATVNDMDCLPESLVRAGRFDRVIEVKGPSREDGRKIIEYYLKNKPIDENVNMDDLTRMIDYESCAELESIMNLSALRAAYAQRDHISMDDLITTVMQVQHKGKTQLSSEDDDELRRIALHEAGHLVVSEALRPGSVGVSAILESARGVKGFTKNCDEAHSKYDLILIGLGGKAAVELYYADHPADGCSRDLRRVSDIIADMMDDDGEYGLAYLSLYHARRGDPADSGQLVGETIVHAELDRYLMRAKDILLRNRAFLEATAEALYERRVLLYSDIRKLREATGYVVA